MELDRGILAHLGITSGNQFKITNTIRHRISRFRPYDSGRRRSHSIGLKRIVAVVGGFFWEGNYL
jgi:hypothetical protein